MSTFYVPPADKRMVAIEHIKNQIKDAVRPFIKGRGKKVIEAHLDMATSAIIVAITPILKIPKGPSKGATVMTEAAAQRNPATGEFLKPPENK